MVNHSLKKKRGEVRYFLLHHGECPRSEGFHYRITPTATENLLTESLRGQHPQTISIQVEGDFETQAPTNNQLLRLKLTRSVPELHGCNSVERVFWCFRSCVTSSHGTRRNNWLVMDRTTTTTTTTTATTLSTLSK